MPRDSFQKELDKALAKRRSEGQGTGFSTEDDDEDDDDYGDDAFDDELSDDDLLSQYSKPVSSSKKTTQSSKPSSKKASKKYDFESDSDDDDDEDDANIFMKSSKQTGKSSKKDENMSKASSSKTLDALLGPKPALRSAADRKNKTTSDIYTKEDSFIDSLLNKTAPPKPVPRKRGDIEPRTRTKSGSSQHSDKTHSISEASAAEKKYGLKSPPRSGTPTHMEHSVSSSYKVRSRTDGPSIEDILAGRTQSTSRPGTPSHLEQAIAGSYKSKSRSGTPTAEARVESPPRSKTPTIEDILAGKVKSPPRSGTPTHMEQGIGSAKSRSRSGTPVLGGTLARASESSVLPEFTNRLKDDKFDPLASFMRRSTDRNATEQLSGELDRTSEKDGKRSRHPSEKLDAASKHSTSASEQRELKPVKRIPLDSASSVTPSQQRTLQPIKRVPLPSLKSEEQVKEQSAADDLLALFDDAAASDKRNADMLNNGAAVERKQINNQTPLEHVVQKTREDMMTNDQKQTRAHQLTDNVIDNVAMHNDGSLPNYAKSELDLDGVQTAKKSKKPKTGSQSARKSFKTPPEGYQGLGSLTALKELNKKSNSELKPQDLNSTSSSDIRQAIYLEWLARTEKELKKKKKLEDEENQKEKEKKEKERQDKLEEATLAHASWLKEKDIRLKDKTQERRQEERARRKKILEKEEEKWKSGKKCEAIRRKQMEDAKRKHREEMRKQREDEKLKQEDALRKKQESQKATEKWMKERSKRWEEDRKREIKEKRKKEREIEKQKREKEEAGAAKYQDWYEKKATSDTGSRRHSMTTIHDDRPAWSPANKVIGYSR